MVLAYGSLAADATPVGPAALRDHRRVWGVAMDNRIDLPSYKAWLDAGGDRPPVFVAFLDVEPAEGARTPGVLVPATDLAALDARERNYERRDVTALVDGAPAGARVWTYVGSATGRARLREGRTAGTAVIAASYLRAVEAAHGPLGDPGLPVAELRRVELP